MNRHLPADKRKSRAQLQQKLRDMADQSGFKIPLVIIFAHGKKIEYIRVFERLLCQIRLGLRQGKGEIGERFAFAFIKTAFYLMHQNIPAPVMLKRVPDIE